MKERFNHLIRDRIVKRSFLLSLAMMLFSFGFLIVLYTQLPPYVPIFNQLTWGQQRLAEKTFLFLPIVITSVLLLFNFLFSQLVYVRMPLVVRMVSITSLFISFISSIFIVRITLLIL